MKSLVLIASLVANLVISSAYAIGSCRAILGSTYLASDFKLSSLGSHFANQSMYPEWSARSADTALRSLNNGVSFETALGNIAKDRTTLAVEQGTEMPSTYGRLRMNMSTSGLFKFDLPDGPPPQKMDLYRAVQKSLGGVPQMATQKVYNSYLLSDGFQIKASTLSRSLKLTKTEARYDSMDADEPTFVTIKLKTPLVLVWVDHSEVGTSRTIMKDVMLRLQNLRASQNLTSNNRNREFVQCIYGYYNAMPFSRGSASIGKVLFAASYYHLFGKKMPTLPEDVDAQAMVLNEDDFHKLFAPYFL